MLRRRREYYIGGPPRRRLPRLLIAVVAVLAIGGAGAAAVAYGLPALEGVTISLPGGPAAASNDPGGAPVEASPDAVPAPTSAVAPVVAEPSVPEPSVAPTASPLPPCTIPTTIEPAIVRSRGDVHRKTVALTFDDGTNPENTRQILGILKKNHANATFFPTGRSMERFPDVWRDVAKAGYPIGNHTYGHPQLAGKCYEAQLAELARADAVFTSLGIPELPVMRPPYELWDDATTVAAAAQGIRAIAIWDVDTNDWAGASTAAIRRVALSGGKGSIVLMHTFPENTAAALPAIIKGYRDRGFEFVTIGQLLGIDGPIPYPPAGG